MIESNSFKSLNSLSNFALRRRKRRLGCSRKHATQGQYEIEVDIESEKHEDSSITLKANISRYNLPNFAVKVKPDRNSYLAGQNAEVEVRADYLFGKPVPGGRVKIVRESERRVRLR